MVTPTNHAIVEPNLNGAGPLALRGFCKIFQPNIGEDQRKSYDMSAGSLAGTAPYYGKSGPG